MPMKLVVVKRGGRKEAFDQKKLSKAIAQAGAEKDADRIAQKIAESLMGKGGHVPSKTIRERVIAELNAMVRRATRTLPATATRFAKSPPAARSWKRLLMASWAATAKWNACEAKSALPCWMKTDLILQAFFASFCRPT